MADTFDSFTERARRVLTLSQEEAHRFSHNYIGTEHLLLGMVRERDGVAAQVLTNLGIQLPKVRSAIEFIIGRGDSAPTGDIGLTPRAKKVIELAVDEARRLDHHYVGTEHLLLGLVREGNGIAAGVLESLGVSLERVRAETLRTIEERALDSQTPLTTPQKLRMQLDASDGVTEEARAVLDRARDESQRRGTGYIGTEHFLLAMTQMECMAAQVLAGLGFDLVKLRFALDLILDQRKTGDTGNQGLSSRAKTVIDLADTEARRLTHRDLNSGHLLLGIVRVREGLASGMLEALGVDLESTRAAVERVVG